MLLRTLEMQGFKSFPDKTQLKFGKGITAVVGPNGSGKSNISDAVRWVLGETSTKSLRGSKMEDVIFGGTSSRKPLGFAQVLLTLDNSDGSLKDKNEVVTVMRRYYRNGDSEYRIDGEVVRRKDVHELFMDTGLGADGYSMVGQGKIDSIISAKNEDRRELFEEAAGISRFRHKRRDAERRLEQAQENLVRLLDILGELESRVGPLKTQSEKAKKFLEYSDEKKNLEIGVWLNKINRFTSELREQEHKIDAVEASYEICEKELADIEQELERISDAAAKINIEIEQVRVQMSAYEEQALRKDGEIKVIRANLEHNNDTIERLKNEINSADDSSVSLDEQIAQKHEAVKESEEKSAQKREELQNVLGRLEKLQNEDKAYSQKYSDLNKALMELTVRLTDYRVKASRSRSSIDEINNRSNSVDDAIFDCESLLKKAMAQKKESEENIAFVNDRIQQGENAMQGYQLRLKSKNDAAQALKDKVETLSRSLEEKNSKARMLSDLEKNMEGFSGAVKAVMKQAGTKNLSGIHGPLSQLISVDNEYSTAIEVALGAAMQNIVVSSESDAKRAINFLKQNKQGRATFLPISAIKPRYMDEHNLDDNFGFIDTASNLVECDDKYKDIVSNLLARVMVVEDIDCAIGISKRYNNKYKIVTLDGQVMNPGGSMTGGSRSRSAGILSRSNLIEELKNDAKKIAQELDEVSAQYKEAVQNANRAAAELQGADADLRNAKEDLIMAQADDKLLGDRIESLKNQKQNLLGEKENSAQRILSLKEEEKQANEQVDAVQNEIDSTENSLRELSDGADQLSVQRDEIRSTAESINLELVTLAKDIEASKQSIEDLHFRKTTQSTRVSEITAEIELIEKNNEELLRQIEAAEQEAAALREKATLAQQDINVRITQRNELEKNSVLLRSTEKEKTADKEKLSSNLVRLEEHKNNMRKEYDELNDMLFEQYELTRQQAQELGIVIEDISAAKKRLHEIKVAIRALGSINVGAIEEYKEVSQRYEFLKEQIDDIESSKSELKKIIDDLTASMSEKFLTQFRKINDEFKISFADFFGGGKGELILEEPDNCLESAIEIKIQPPGKSVQNINLFSGGEKSLAAMALLFSVLKVTPSPFCIYDEVEAALDDVNVERFAKYMRKMTDKTQFISITHRRGTMEEADVLYGVTMQEKGVSKLLELQSAELAAKMGLDA